MARGVPLLMLILWVYFLVPLLIGQNVPGFVTMLVTLVIYEGAFLSEVVRGGIEALAVGPDGSGPRVGPQLLRRDALGDPAAGAVQHDAQHAQPVRSTIKETTLGYVINVPELTLRPTRSTTSF